MSLSSDLISQFVKMTNDKTVSKSGTTVYGTVKIDGDVISVKLDGADQSTPAITTADVKNGERVTVLIKDHRAIITGNIDSPAARIGDVQELGNNVVIIDRLLATKANISDLEVERARIDELVSKTITTQNLEATNASIENLETQKLDAATARMTYATIDTLNSMQGTIQTLSSDTAKINTLIFGSATGNVIQTSFSNSVISQLGDAQIKSAMIDSISASKITAGDIVTNNVRVMSEDGRLLISDETLQISDPNRVRVQIGKDASGDYSINVWDQNGNLMFSKGGITDSAIKTAIIRNDMVSETANIAASKLNIDSLFEEINGSSKTIKSSRVYLDESKQTLDISFKALTTNVTSLSNTVSSQGTAIGVIQGQITSKIWQQDINAAKGEMTTKYSTLEQDVNGFKSTVSSTYAKKVDLNNIEIGGRNLLRNSRLISMFSNNSNVYPVSCTEVTENGVTFYRVRRTNTAEYPNVTMSVYSSIPKTSFAYGEMTGKQVTLSFKARVSHEITGGFMDFTYGGPSVIDFGKSSETFTTDWKTYYIVVDAFPDLTDHTGIRWNPYTFQLTADILNDFYLDIRDYKFEFGNKPTDWTPAVEDMATAEEADSAQATANDAALVANNAETLIKQLADSISMLVTDGNGTSLMTQTEDGWTFSTSNIQTLVNKISEDLNTLTENVGNTNDAVDVLKQAVSDLGETAEYVKIGTYENEPCIEFGEADSDFRLRITNTRMVFTEGSDVLAYFNNQALHIKKAIVEEELQQGGFVWKVRSNGNYGLTWKGGNS